MTVGPRIDLHADPKGPTKVAVAPDGRRVYVEQWAQGFLTVVDPVANTTVGTPIALDSGSGVPRWMAVRPDGQRVYSGVSVVDTSGTAVLGNPVSLHNPDAGNVFEAPGIAITPDGRRLYVTGVFDPANGPFVGRVWVIDSATGAPIGNPITVGDTPSAIAIAPDGRRAYVVNLNSNTVNVIDTGSNTLVGDPIPVGNQPQAVAVTPDGRRVYVAHSTDSRVSVIDTSTDSVVASPDLQADGTDLAVSPDGRRVYVVNEATLNQSEEVTTIDTTTNTVIGDPVKIPGATGIAISPDGHRIYVSDNNSGLTAIDTGR